MGGGRYSSLPNVSMCLNAGAMGRQDAESETLIPTFGGGFDVAHTLRADGFDASEDGTGRGTPLVPCYAIQAGALRTNPESGPDGVGVQEGVAYTLEARAEVQCVAFDCKAGGNTALSIGDVPGTLRAAHGGGHAAVAIRLAQTGSNGIGVTDELAYTLDSAQQVIASSPHVRRLTPRECERLQGAPDDWTAIPVQRLKRKRVTKLRPEDRWLRDGDGWLLLMADGPRYKMLGNSFAVPVIRWIGRQLQAAHTTGRAAA